MEDKHVAIIGFIIGFVSVFIIGFLCISYSSGILSDGYNDFTYAPHYVKIHVSPEHEGISVAAWASDEFPPTTGYTDNNSEIIFPMISSAKYNILVDNNRCSYYIYPSESYYKIICGDKIK